MSKAAMAGYDFARGACAALCLVWPTKLKPTRVDDVLVGWVFAHHVTIPVRVSLLGVEPWADRICSRSNAKLLIGW